MDQPSSKRPHHDEPTPPMDLDPVSVNPNNYELPVEFKGTFGFVHGFLSTAQPVDVFQFALIANHSVPSTFGTEDGARVLDTQFRSSLEKNEVMLNTSFIEAITNQAKKAFRGVEYLKFHKLLVYQVGCGFGLHVDQKRASGMTHTVIVNIPVEGNVTKIRLKYAFEQVPENVTLPSTGVGPKLVMTPKIYVYHGDMSFAEGKLKTVESKSASEWPNQTEAMIGIDTWIQRITEHRIRTKTIRPTPNNPESSRSHLYLSFEIEFAKGKRGHVTIVDMAGREDPFALFEKLFDVKRMTLESSSFKNESAKKDKTYDKDPRKYYASSIQKLLEPRVDMKELKKYLKTPSEDPNDAIDLIREGFYINESINHLRVFFKSKMGSVKLSATIPDLKNYTPSSFVYSVSSERDVKSSNILMIPILKWLDHGIQKDQKKPTKFAMLCAIRQESNYCTDSIATLEFADSIKST